MRVRSNPDGRLGRVADGRQPDAKSLGYLHSGAHGPDGHIFPHPLNYAQHRAHGNVRAFLHTFVGAESDNGTNGYCDAVIYIHTYTISHANGNEYTGSTDRRDHAYGDPDAHSSADFDPDAPLHPDTFAHGCRF
jgi:hypothetical protein